MIERVIILVEKDDESNGSIKNLLNGRTGKVWEKDGSMLKVFFGASSPPLVTLPDVEAIFGVHGDASDCYPVLSLVGAKRVVGYYQSSDSSIWKDVTALCSGTEENEGKTFDSLWRQLANRNQERMQVALWQEIGYPLSQVIVALELKRLVEPEAGGAGSQELGTMSGNFRRDIKGLLDELKRGPAHRSGRFEHELGQIRSLIDVGSTLLEALIRDLKTIVSASLRASEGQQGIV